MEKIWEEEVLSPAPSSPTTAPSTLSALMERKISADRANGGEWKPPVPPRRRGLWGIASALGERAVSWGGESGDKRANAASTLENQSTNMNKAETSANTSSKPSALPPPLPKRSENRTQRKAETVDASTTAADPSATNTAAALPDLPRSPTRATHLKRHSQGNVSAPASAATVLLQRSQTPTNVPLPESQPGTPGNDGATVPSRTTSPTPFLSGTPPPIPRRAAARTRGSATERVGGEQLSSLVAKSENVNGEQVGDGVKKEVSETKIEDGKAASASNESRDNTHGSSVDGDKLTPPKAQDSVDNEIERAEVPDVPPASSTNGEPADNDDDGNAGKDGPASNNVASTEQSGRRVNGTSAGDLVLVGKEEDLGVVGDLEDGNEKKQRGFASAEKDLSNYVGEGTWEERTWRELVRLREDMFWARMGGVAM